MSAAPMPSGPGATSFAVRSVSRSHVGLTRAINEDRILDAPEFRLWAIADGMGGHYGGDIAAQTVVDALRHAGGPGASPSRADILRSLARANGEIYNSRRGSGTTVVALSLEGRSVHILWAGDSRCYRIRDGKAELMTRDHSLVQELTDSGLITAEAAACHPQANVITRALGAAPDCALDERHLDLQPFDRFLLCSDGLSRTLRLEDPQDGSIDRLADDLLARALARDGSDNISLVLVEVGAPADG